MSPQLRRSPRPGFARFAPKRRRGLSPARSGSPVPRSCAVLPHKSWAPTAMRSRWCRRRATESRRRRRTCRLAAGRAIVILQQQFPSNVYAWYELAKKKGGRVVVAPRESGMNWTELCCGRSTRTTAIVAVPQCHWTDGSTVDLERVGRACACRGRRHWSSMPANRSAPARSISSAYSRTS